MSVSNVFGNVFRGLSNKVEDKETAAALDHQTAAAKELSQAWDRTDIGDDRVYAASEKSDASGEDHTDSSIDGQRVWELIGSCIRSIFDCDSFSTALQQIIQAAGSYMGADRAYCFWLKDDIISNSISWTQELGISFSGVDLVLGERRVELWQSFFSEQEYILLPEPEDMREVIPENLKEVFLREQLSGIILIPLRHQEQLIQLIAFDNPGLPKEELTALTDTLYCLLNLSLNRVYERKRNFQLTYYDSLTGLYNRTKFWNDMRNATREEKSCTGIVLIHMKNLRKINETEGHEAGNQMLKRFAAAIDEIMPGEIVYRIGGSDFVLWMQQLEQLEFTDKVMDLKAAFEDESAVLSASWTEYATDLYQMAMAMDEELYQKLSEKERKYHFR